jgi:hypothetical protein
MLVIIALLMVLLGSTPTTADDCDSNCVVQQGSGSGN